MKQFDAAKKSSKHTNRQAPILLHGLIWTHCLKGNLNEATIPMKDKKIDLKTEYIPILSTGISAAYPMILMML
jgi:hypothetical protein